MTTTIQGSAPVRPSVRILDLNIDRYSTNDVMDVLETFVQEGVPRQVVTVNLQFMSEARKDSSFADLINQADLSVADGKPLLWVSKVMGEPIESRITGHDLLRQCAELSQAKGYSMFLLGGAPGAADDAVLKLRENYPGLRVDGTAHGMFAADGRAEREYELITRIKDFAPQFLFVALGCPKQEYFERRYMERLNVPVSIGIGGTLEVYTDRLKRAPQWMQDYGIEWVYRFKQEPKRLWKRYVLNDMPTTLIAMATALKGRMFKGSRG